MSTTSTYAALSALLLVSCATPRLGGTEANAVAERDLALAVGDWTGTLSYLDFSSGASVALPLELSIQQDGPCLSLEFVFPEEPQANSESQRCLSAGGTQFDERPITERTQADESVSFELAYDGEDNGKPALKRETYRFSEETLFVETAFRRSEADAWTVRNTIEVEPSNQ